MSPVIEITGLRKEYRRRGKIHAALNGFDMVVEAGQIHGFLGPNGSGKTTTLRALMGLVRVDSGSMSLLSAPVPARQAQVAPRIGAIVEAPTFFPNFSGRRTLSLLATTAGLKPARVEEVLELVDMRDRAADRVKSYSLGMRSGSPSPRHCSNHRSCSSWMSPPTVSTPAVSGTCAI